MEPELEISHSAPLSCLLRGIFVLLMSRLQKLAFYPLHKQNIAWP